MLLLLSGGVGGSKLVRGFANQVDEKNLIVIANTGDDFELYGLKISPDIDTILYNLAGIGNKQTGWGIENDSFQTHKQLLNYMGEIWFKLGDKDLATHLFRTEMFNNGKSLSEITEYLARCLKVTTCVAPMSDEKVETRIITSVGDLHFQDYLVKRQATDYVEKIYYKGIEDARPSKKFQEGLTKAKAIILCPSNPLVSIGPILAIPGVKDMISKFTGPRIAVSPIVGGNVIKGPLNRMLNSLGIEPSAYSVAKMYQNLIDIFIIDELDANLKDLIEKELGIKVYITNTIMRTEDDKSQLAKFIINNCLTCVLR